LEATWKYVIITTAGIVFALFGTILLAVAIGDETCKEIATLRGHAFRECGELESLRGRDRVDLMAWSELGQRSVARKLEPHLVLLSFVFVLVGYGTKAGFAPMHTWLPDGHGEAPSPVSALLSGVLLKSALFAILRFYTITNLNWGSAEFTSVILLGSGLLSLFLATPFILKRNKFKRILAYHSLEHMGIIVFGLGIGGPVALFGALLHALNHALTKAFMFLTFSNVRREYAQQQGRAEPDEAQMQGVLPGMPVSGTMLLYGGLGLVGSPPFNIFLSELLILWAAFQLATDPSSGQQYLPPAFYAGAVALFLVSVTLIFAGLVQHLARILLGRPPGPAGEESNLARPERPKYAVQERLAEVLPLIALAVVIVVFGIWIPTWPIDFPELLRQSVSVLQHGASEVSSP
jgi:hydrogenase-4 component F